MIKFLGEGHRARFNVVAADLEFAYGIPGDWAACLFILTADEYTWKAVSPHVDTKAHMINWAKIRRLVTGRGHGFLLRLAQYLYNGTGALEFELLWETLDDKNFALAMAAIQVRRRGVQAIEGAA